MLCDLVSEPSEGVQRRTHRSSARLASVAADFRRQINQRNDDGKRADDLANCANCFPIHGMVHVIALDIQSHCGLRRKACRDPRRLVRTLIDSKLLSASRKSVSLYRTRGIKTISRAS